MVELVREQQRMPAEADEIGLALPFRPIVIQISSDPDYPGITWPQPEEPDENDEPGNFVSELWAPLGTLFNTRTARGHLAAESLKYWVEQQLADHHFSFRLYPNEDWGEPPLGWVLSDKAQQGITCQLSHENNVTELKRLAEMLQLDAPEFPPEFMESCRKIKSGV